MRKNEESVAKGLIYFILRFFSLNSCFSVIKEKVTDLLCKIFESRISKFRISKNFGLHQIEFYLLEI
jgi:hypothetical protein